MNQPKPEISPPERATVIEQERESVKVFLDQYRPAIEKAYQEAPNLIGFEDLAQEEQKTVMQDFLSLDLWAQFSIYGDHRTQLNGASPDYLSPITQEYFESPYGNLPFPYPAFTKEAKTNAGDDFSYDSALTAAYENHFDENDPEAFYGYSFVELGSSTGGTPEVESYLVALHAKNKLEETLNEAGYEDFINLYHQEFIGNSCVSLIFF